MVLFDLQSTFKVAQELKVNFCRTHIINIRDISLSTVTVQFEYNYSKRL